MTADDPRDLRDAPPSPPRRVLLVDDEHDALASVKDLLELGLGVRVDTTCDAVAALDYLRDGPPPDVIISDYRMRGMDGGEFLTRARHAAPEAHRLLLYPFTPADPDAFPALDGGQVCPTDPDGLLDCVRQLLAERSGRAPPAAAGQG